MHPTDATVAALHRGPHAVLGIQTQASAEEVRAAFRRAALRTHPDKAGGSKEAFAAVQRAYDLLAGQLGPDFLLSPQPSHQGQQSTMFHNLTPSQQSGACGSNATEQPPEAWDSGAFDPWSSASLESFDPWSTASLTGSTHSLSAAPTAETAETQPMAAASGKGPSKKRKRPDKANIRPMARPRWKKGVDQFSLDEETRQLMRNGVYGYRADDSSSDDASDELVAAVASGLAPRPVGAASAHAWSDVAVHQPASARTSLRAVALPLAHTSTTMQVTQLAAQTRPTWASKSAGLGQYYCSLHKRLRFESALVDDGEGNPVCKPGMECP
mmetsp:Transcript_125707/g.245039  ORF Transcript_125707/g.245039 Transcript_125707/m.245039 type:complete len:327 (-) Transcript_125707:61-1041(-)